MATQLQDLQAKRKELQATNPNATMLDARTALTPAPIVQNPVNPITPPTPTNPQDIVKQYNQNQLQENKAKVAWEIQAGTRPQVWNKYLGGTPKWNQWMSNVMETWQQQKQQYNASWYIMPDGSVNPSMEWPPAPVTPTETPAKLLTTPTATTPATTATQTTPTTPTAPIITPDSNSIYTNLRNNTPLPDTVKTTQAYKDAQNRYNNFQKYASYDVNTLTTALSNGTILPGTSTWNDLMTDPVMWGKILQAKALTNWKWVDYSTTTQQASDNIVANSPTVAWMLADWVITAEEWAQSTNTPEVTAKMADVETKKNAYDALKAKYDDVETQVKADFPWSPFADSIIADRRKAMFKDLTIASDTYNNALGTLTQLKQDASSLFEANMKLYQEQVQAQQQKAQQDQQFAQSIALKQMDYAQQQNTPSFQTIGDKVYKVQNGQITDTGIQAEKWATFQVLGDKVYKIKGDSITEVPWIDAGKVTSWDFGIQVIGQHFDTNSQTMVNDYWTVDKNTGTVTPISQQNNALIQQYPNDAGLKNNNPAGLTWGISNNLKQKLIDAWVQFSQGTARPANEWGSYIQFASPQDWIKAYQIALTTWGSDDIYSRLKQWVWTTNGDNYASQILTASGLTKWAKFSELTQSQLDTLMTNQIKRESPWFYALVTWGQQQPTQVTQPWQYTDEQVALLSSIDKLTADSKKTLAQAWLTATDFAKFNDGQLPPTNKQKEQAQSIINSINNLETHPWFSTAVGMSLLQPWFTMAGTDKADFQNQFNSFRDTLVLPNLGQLKWPMSDKDVAFLRNTATALNLSSSEDQFKKNLEELKQKYQSIVDKGTQWTNPLPSNTPQVEKTWVWQVNPTSLDQATQDALKFLNK